MKIRTALSVFLATALLFSCTTGEPPGKAESSIPSPLLGNWYVGGDRGKACLISDGTHGMVARNESGSVSKLTSSSKLEVTAVDWGGGVRGSVHDDHILWSNGTWWARTPAP